MTVAVGVAGLAVALYLWLGGVIGSEFLPHLDEGALWVRGTLAPSTGPTEGIRLSNQARLMLCSFPEVTQCTSQIGRPDDGTDTTGFFNTEYFVDLKPKEQWRPAFHQNKDEADRGHEPRAGEDPGRDLGLLAADRRQHGRSGQRRQGTACHQGLRRRFETFSKTRPTKIVKVMRKVKGIEDLGVFRVLGQPNVNFTVDREQAARYQINVADVQDAIQTAVGGNALTQVLQGEQRYDLVMRYLPQYPRHQGSDREHSPAGAHRRAGFAGAALQGRRAGRRLGDLPRRQPALCRRSSTACAAATWAARWRKPSRR